MISSNITDKRRMLAADGGLLLAAFFWGCSFAAMKGALDAFPTLWLLALRFNMAFIILYVFLGHNFIGQPRKLYSMGLISGLMLFSGFALQTYGLEFTTSSKQAFITSIYVVLVPIFMWLITRVPPSKITWLSALMCCLGMGVLTSEKVSAFNVGDTFTLLSTFLFAAHIIYVGYASRIVSPILLTALQIGVVGILSLILAPFLTEWPGFNGTDGIFEVAFAVIFPTIGAFSLQNIAQKYTTSTHAAIIMSLEGVFGVFAGVLLLGEIFTIRMGIGCAVIFSAVLLSELAPIIFCRVTFNQKEETKSEV